MVADDGEFRVGTDERLAFLPSPVTWLEWRIPKSEAKARVGVLLEQKAHTPDAATVFFGFDSGSIAVVAMLVLPLRRVFKPCPHPPAPTAPIAIDLSRSGGGSVARPMGLGVAVRPATEWRQAMRIRRVTCPLLSQ